VRHSVLPPARPWTRRRCLRWCLPMLHLAPPTLLLILPSSSARPWPQPCASEGLHALAPPPCSPPSPPRLTSSSACRGLSKGRRPHLPPLVARRGRHRRRCWMERASRFWGVEPPEPPHVRRPRREKTPATSLVAIYYLRLFGHDAFAHGCICSLYLKYTLNILKILMTREAHVRWEPKWKV
jgi:hypothetical protein